MSSYWQIGLQGVLNEFRKVRGDFAQLPLMWLFEADGVPGMTFDWGELPALTGERTVIIDGQWCDGYAWCLALDGPLPQQRELNACLAANARLKEFGLRAAACLQAAPSEVRIDVLPPPPHPALADLAATPKWHEVLLRLAHRGTILHLDAPLQKVMTDGQQLRFVALDEAEQFVKTGAWQEAFPHRYYTALKPDLLAATELALTHLAKAEDVPAADFVTSWPLGMKADMQNRRVQRNGRTVDLSASKALWDILATLAKNLPATTPPGALVREAAADTAVYTNISKLKKRLLPLKITISRAPYLLVESNS